MFLKIGLLVILELGVIGSVFSSLLEQSENEEPNKLLQRKTGIIYQQQKEVKYDQSPNLELVLDVKNLPHGRRKHRRGDKLKKKKTGRTKQKNNKIKMNSYDEISRSIARNNEKVDLVRNRTVEILKNGVRILNTGEPESNRSIVKVNETLLEKILSSASVSKPDVLISASGIYKLPIGGDIYSSKKLSKPDNDYNRLNKNQTLEKQERANQRNEGVEDYVVDESGEWDAKKQNEHVDKSAGTMEMLEYESNNGDYNIGETLEQLVQILQNLNDTKCTNMFNCNSSSGMDPCDKWLNCRHHLECAFIGDMNLPSCPCLYPSTIFYDDKIWDDKQRRLYRWKDASSDYERLDVYKLGATYCIRSLLAQGSQGVAVQQCCYDRELRLITRGSGAGTINYVSPDVSKRLHETVDILPWRLCKGDFTRYNLARQPNNGNNCPVNPQDSQYNKQIQYSKYF